MVCFSSGGGGGGGGGVGSGAFSVSDIGRGASLGKGGSGGTGGALTTATGSSSSLLAPASRVGLPRSSHLAPGRRTILLSSGVRSVSRSSPRAAANDNRCASSGVAASVTVLPKIELV